MILKDEITSNFQVPDGKGIYLTSKDCLNVESPEMGRDKEKARVVKGDRPVCIPSSKGTGISLLSLCTMLAAPSFY